MKISFKCISLSFVVVFGMILSETVFAGDNLLADASRSISLHKDKTSTVWQKALSFEKKGNNPVIFRARFRVENPKIFSSLMLKKPIYIRNLTLNGKTVPKPMKGMYYKSITGIPVSLLKKGTNELLVSWTQRVRIRKDKKTSKVSIVPKQIDSAKLNISLLGLTPSDLAFQTGPILGYAGKSFFTLSCRVNMPAEVVLQVDKRQFVSKPALLHSFKVEGLKTNTKYNYSLKTRITPKGKFSVSSGPYSVRTLTGGEKFKFAVLGDSRTRPKDWAKVAVATLKARPEFSVFVGDMVSSGRHDYQWDEQYFSPAKEYFATIPYYAIIGNHEQNAPLFTRIFQTPGGKNWSQKIGSVLLIGIDGAMDWNKGSKLTKWLENLLAKSKSKFIFLFSHYPAWSSGGHGRLNAKGQPRERNMRLSRNVIMPLLKKYEATAMFAGHDHIYERSEPKEGISMIVTGGAGAPLYGKVKNAKIQNPYSKVFARKFHYCILEIDGDICMMKVFTPNGKKIDERIWKARK